MKLWQKRLLGAGAIVFAGLAAAGIGYIQKPKKASITGETLGKNTLSVSPNDKIKLNSQSVKIFADKNVESFSVVENTSGAEVVISQQALQSTFNEGTLATLLLSLTEYASFDSQFGKVHLTQSAATGNLQTAILWQDNKLIFGRTNKDMTLDQWKSVYAALH